MKEEQPIKFYNISSILDTNLNQRRNNVEKVDQLLKGIDLNEPRDHHDLTLLNYFVIHSNENAVNYLLNRGADPGICSNEIYSIGPAILYALDSNLGSIECRIRILKKLIAHSESVNIEVHWRDDYKEEFVQGTIVEYGIKLGAGYVHYLDELINAKYDREKVSVIQQMLSILVQEGAEMTEDTREKLNDFLAISTEPKRSKDSPEKRYKEAKATLDNIEYRIRDLYDAVIDVCEKHMYDKDFVESKEWAQLFRYLVDISLTFEEVAEDAYEGEVVSFEDDEGWLSQSWDNYNWFTELVEILSQNSAIKNPAWDELLAYVITEHEKYDSLIQEELEELFDKPMVKKHRSYKKLLKLAEEHVDDFQFWK